VFELRGPALDSLRSVLGLVGPGAQVTEVPDGVVDVGFDANAFARRGLTIAPSYGLWAATITNVHNTGGASTLTAQLNPFVLNASVNNWNRNFPGEPWPGDKFDLWLLYVSVHNTLGAGNVASARVSLVVGNTWRAVGSSSVREPLVFASTTEVVLGTETHLNPIATGISMRLPCRVPPPIPLQFQSVTAGAPNSTYVASLLFGLFPAGLGQDLIGGQ